MLSSEKFTPFRSARSKFVSLGPVKTFLPKLPLKPTAGKEKHDGLNQCSTVGWAVGSQPARYLGRAPECVCRNSGRDVEGVPAMGEEHSAELPSFDKWVTVER